METVNRLDEMLMDSHYETRQKEYYDVKGAAAFLRSTVARIRTLINRGLVKPIKIDGKNYFRAEDLAALLTLQ
jgi:hypothetical protein